MKNSEYLESDPLPYPQNRMMLNKYLDCLKAGDKIYTPEKNSFAAMARKWQEQDRLENPDLRIKDVDVNDGF